MQYAQLPMGSRNSMGASGHYGNAFVQYVLEHCPGCSGQLVKIDVMTALPGERFDLKLGIGFILIEIEWTSNMSGVDTCG